MPIYIPTFKNALGNQDSTNPDNSRPTHDESSVTGLNITENHPGHATFMLKLMRKITKFPKSNFIFGPDRDFKNEEFKNSMLRDY